MQRCEFCNYFYYPGNRRDAAAETVCAICAARTTRELREAFQQGRRISHPYMDSD